MLGKILLGIFVALAIILPIVVDLGKYALLAIVGIGLLLIMIYFLLGGKS